MSNIAKLMRLKNLELCIVEMILSEAVNSKKPIKWSVIASLSFAKKTIREIIVWPISRLDSFRGLSSHPQSTLLFRPPGTGKTLIGNGMAN
jgi:SpoVK/Ycf46/Vps4 family AAA+-type ATPase